MPRPPGRSNKHVRRLVHDAICDPPRVLVCRVVRPIPPRRYFLPFGRAVLWDDPDGVTLDYDPEGFTFRDPLMVGVYGAVIVTTGLAYTKLIPGWGAAIANFLFAGLVFRALSFERRATLIPGALRRSMRIAPGSVQELAVTANGIAVRIRTGEIAGSASEVATIGFVLNPIAPAAVDDVVSLFERLSNAPQGEPQRRPPLGE